MSNWYVSELGVEAGMRPLGFKATGMGAEATGMVLSTVTGVAANCQGNNMTGS